MRNKTQLLPFGKALASTFESEPEFLALLQRHGRPVVEFNFTGAKRGASATGVRIGDLVVMAACSEPFHARCAADPQLAFILPVAGSGKIRSRASSLDWKASKTIIINSYDEELEIFGSTCSAVVLRPSPGKLVDALAGAISDGHGPRGADPEDIRKRLLARGPVIDDGRTWSIDYFSAIMKVVELVDDCGCDEALLARIGLEDVLNRLLARLALEQAHGAGKHGETQGKPRSTRAVDLICDRIRSTIGNPMSISQMEELTGLTGRALNYAFRSRFSCSPQEWQRNFLLDHARQLLKDPHYTGSVKSLSYELGFSSPSSFAAHYRQRFGERPSVSRGGAAAE